MKIFIISIFYFLNLSFAAAKKIPPRKPANLDQWLEVSTTVSEVSTQFKIISSNGSSSIYMHTSSGIDRKREISKADFDFLLSEYAKLPVPAQLPADCYRSKIELQSFRNGALESKKSSCFGLNTVTEKSYIRFSRILVDAM